MMVIRDFHGRSFLDKGNKFTFISLFPKKKGADSINDYRPVTGESFGEYIQRLFLNVWPN